MFLAIENDVTSDPLLELGLCAIECEASTGFSIAKLQNQSYQA